MSTLAGWLFVAVAVLFVGAVVGLVLVGRSVYVRSRALAQELTSLGGDLERIISVVGQPAQGPGDNPRA
ncbi:MAG: hypothetical protein ACRDWI_04560 [Jiangellaceae bacterium]